MSRHRCLPGGENDGQDGGWSQVNNGWHGDPPPAGWADHDVNFDDSAWAPASEFGLNGVGPWGDVNREMGAADDGGLGVISADAQWIWSADPDAHNDVYCRLVVSCGGGGGGGSPVAPTGDFSDRNCLDFNVDSYAFDIASTGTLIDTWTQNADDGWVEVVLPFSFPWYGKTEDTIHIGTNGYLTFGTAHFTNGASEPIPGTPDGPVDGVIGVYWADINPDLNPDGASGVYYQAFDDSFVTQWDHVRYWTGDGNLAMNTFQGIVFSDGGVMLNYLDMNPNGDLSWSDESIGFEDQAGTNGFQISLGIVPESGTSYYVPATCTAAAPGTAFCADYATSCGAETFEGCAEAFANMPVGDGDPTNDVTEAGTQACVIAHLSLVAGTGHDSPHCEHARGGGEGYCLVPAGTPVPMTCALTTDQSGCVDLAGGDCAYTAAVAPNCRYTAAGTLLSTAYAKDGGSKPAGAILAAGGNGVWSSTGLGCYANTLDQDALPEVCRF